MRFRPILLFVVFAAGFAPASRASDDARFSKTLAFADFAQTGLARLNSDQLAALDALVRRDLVAAEFVTKTPRAARFSQRLSADERRVAGLTLLSEPELAQLDLQVERLMPAPRSSTTTPYTTGGTNAVPSVTLRRAPEIHGEVTLLYGAGSGGFSEMGGSLVVSVEDPAHHMAIAVGYSELHTKGGYLRRDCRDGFSRFDDLGLATGFGP